MLRIEVLCVATSSGRFTDARRFEAPCHFHFKPKKIPRIRHLDPFTLKAVIFHSKRRECRAPRLSIKSQTPGVPTL